MKDGTPVIYWTFRTVWTLVHFIIVAVAAVSLLVWAGTDNNAARVWRSSTENLLDVQRGVSNMIPWPWSAGEPGDDARVLSAGETERGSRPW